MTTNRPTVPPGELRRAMGDMAGEMRRLRPTAAVQSVPTACPGRRWL